MPNVLNRISGLLVVSSALNGILGGAGLVRTFVDMPAWRVVGAAAWADFSRHADLGYGLAVYPALGIGGALATIAALVVHLRSGRVARAATAPLLLGAVLVAIGMITTGFAAPQMLGLRAPLDAAAVQRAFDRFALWGGIRAVAQAGAFAANLWGIVRVARGEAR